jgi:hypothetical protein
MILATHETPSGDNICLLTHRWNAAANGQKREQNFTQTLTYAQRGGSGNVFPHSYESFFKPLNLNVYLFLNVDARVGPLTNNKSFATAEILCPQSCPQRVLTLGSASASSALMPQALFCPS